MDVDSGCRQLLKALGEKLREEKQCGVSAKTKYRLMEQKRESRNRATPQGHLIYNKDLTATHLLLSSRKRLPIYLVSLLALHTEIISRCTVGQNVKGKQ